MTSGEALERILEDALRQAGWGVLIDRDLDLRAATDMVAVRPDGARIRLQVTRKGLVECLQTAAGRMRSKAGRFLVTGKDSRLQGTVSVFLAIHGLDGEEEEVLPAVLRALNQIRIGDEPTLIYFSRACRNGMVAPLRSAIAAATKEL